MLRQFQLIAGETAMRRLARSRGQQDYRNEMPVVITVGIIILVGTVVVCAGLVAIPLWTVLFSR
jgi:hypothetical protein